jgi:N-acetylglucosaminyl-diphospho-decaprenol L-rhamnosyltransferase
MPAGPPGREPAGIGIVVVNFGSHRLLETNLAGLDLAGIGARVFVVDNFRSAADAQAIAEAAVRHGWQLRALGRNAGFGAAANLGAELAVGAGCDTLVVVNPDLAISAEVLAELAAATRADPKVMISPRIVRPGGEVWFEGGHLSLDEGRARSGPGPAGERTPPWLSGACLAVHRDLWQLVGGFDPDYFLYWEDVDLSYRVTRAGGRLLVRPDLLAVHDVGGTQHAPDQRAKSPVYYYFNCRNRLLFAAKHLDAADRRRWSVQTPADVRRVLLRGGRRQLVRPDLTVWPATRGALAGLLRMLRPR